MVSGLPIVARGSCAGGIAEQIDEACGVLVPPDVDLHLAAHTPLTSPGPPRPRPRRAVLQGRRSWAGAEGGHGTRLVRLGVQK